MNTDANASRTKVTRATTLALDPLYASRPNVADQKPERSDQWHGVGHCHAPPAAYEHGDSDCERHGDVDCRAHQREKAEPDPDEVTAIERPFVVDEPGG